MAIGDRYGLTAAHCIDGGGLSVDGQILKAYDTGEDLAYLTGRFPPPYARLGRRLTPVLAVEGFGCGTARHGLEVRPARGERAVSHPEVVPLPGMRIKFAGRVCPGDSGGALWNADGELVGILTGTSKDGSERNGWATPVAGDPILPE